MKKTFILTQFGKPHPWTQKFIDSVQFLGKYGWEWKIFTPNDFRSKGNVEITYMTVAGFNQLCKDALGIFPNVNLVDGLPDKPMSDFYIASGQIFRAWLRDSDYWGITNWDIVYGRLDRFLPDEELVKYDIWSDDILAINGIFSLYRNFDTVNTLFMQLKNWKEIFCSEQLFGSDEYGLTRVVRRAVGQGELTLGGPELFPMHSHDRLRQHQPVVRLKRYNDGALYELFEDIDGPKWEHGWPFLGREIPYFHFIRTKEWPKLV